MRPDHPIIFSAPMVCALLEGRKTMTRRIAFDKHEGSTIWARIPVGHRMWVKETFTGKDGAYRYRADDLEDLKWTSGLLMPRIASRLTLILTATKVEPLNSITTADAIKEGVESWQAYRDLWTELHGILGTKSWSANPRVAALTFTVHRCNIDKHEKELAA